MSTASPPMQPQQPPSIPQDIGVNVNVERVEPSVKPMEISLPLPRVPHTTLHIHLTFLATSTMVFLATTTPGDGAGTLKPMGSFVYAMPDVSSVLSFFFFFFCLSFCVLFAFRS